MMPTFIISIVATASDAGDGEWSRGGEDPDQADPGTPRRRTRSRARRISVV
jgi:hypothetical protein